MRSNQFLAINISHYSMYSKNECGHPLKFLFNLCYLKGEPMKKQLFIILMATAFSSTAFAENNQSPVDVQGSGSSMGAGFENWAGDVLKYGGPGGQVLASEAKAWVLKSKQIGQV